MTKKSDKPDAPDPDELTDWERRKVYLYKDAARESTREVLESFGFDVDDANEMQKDMYFNRRLRKTSEAASTKFVTSGIALLFGAIGAVITLAFQSLLGK